MAVTRWLATKQINLTRVIGITLLALVASGCGVTGSPSQPGTSGALSVSIGSPGSGATVSGSVTITASASGSATATSVQFEIDGTKVGAPVPAAPLAPFAFAWNTTKSANGKHTLTAVATDSSGGTVTSAGVAVTVSNNTGDTTPPRVSIASPASGATVSGTITVTANASDNVAVASVQFAVDGKDFGNLDLASPYSQSLNTTTLTNGAHTLTAIATDTSGNKATSSGVSITVSNKSSGTTPPTVSITSPASGATVSGTITVTANASGNVAVASVQFAVDGTDFGSLDTSAPYSQSLNTTTLSNGSHTLTAIATDTSNNKATSAGVSITVNNASNQPAVSITSPLSGTTVKGTITISATASDSKGIANVQFQVDGSDLGSAESASPYAQSWNTTSVGDGTHTVTVVATSSDSSQQPGTATAVVTVNNSGSGPVLSSTPGWYKIPGTALCGGPENSALTAPDNFPANLDASYTAYGVGFTSQCYNIYSDSNGAVFDTTRNRMIIWGGGHEHYWGNDVFGLEVNNIGTGQPVMFRYDNPANGNYYPLTGGPANGGEILPGGFYMTGGSLDKVETLPACSYVSGCSPTGTTPGSRHTYNNLAYVPGSDIMLNLGGATGPIGYGSSDTWTLAMGTVLASCAPSTVAAGAMTASGCNPQWTDLGVASPLGAGVGCTTCYMQYDPNHMGVWGVFNDASSQVVAFFNSSSPSWFVNGGVEYGSIYANSVLDPVDQYFVLLSGLPTGSTQQGLYYFSTASPTATGLALQTPTTTNCGTVLNPATATGSTINVGQYEGLAWDPIANQIAIFPNGGNVLYYLNPKTWTCTGVTYGSTAGTDYPATHVTSGNDGTFGRFQYVPAYDIFVLCNDPFNDCWYLRPQR